MPEFQMIAKLPVLALQTAQQEFEILIDIKQKVLCFDQIKNTCDTSQWNSDLISGKKG
jgi:hypothetical protein